MRRSDVQRLVDDLAPTLSGSRVRSVVNAIRSLYRWAQERELVSHDPAALVRLPAMNATPRDRVATPGEFATLLAALEIEDALPYALAGHAMGRRAQIQRLR
jgi:site-specific recombinase XerD